MKKLKTTLLAIAQASFDFNRSAGRKGPEWAIGQEATFQALKRIEELETALAPFAKYADIALRHSRKNEDVIAYYGTNSADEPDHIELKARHFKKAKTLLKGI